MATRMQRYYKESNQNTRSKRNKNLYKNIYEYGQYSNIEGIASLDNSSEIDITKIKEMLEKNEPKKTRRTYHEEIKPEVKPEKAEEHNYDLRDVLAKAREKMPQDDKERVLRDSKYDFLTKVKEESGSKKKPEEELKELINTITSTSMLNKLGDNTLAMELFSDLASSEDEKDPQSLKEYEEKTKEEPKENTLDKSFFTSSLNLSKSDFITDDEKKKRNPLQIIIIIILILIILGCLGLLVYKRFL